MEVLVPNQISISLTTSHAHLTAKPTAKRRRRDDVDMRKGGDVNLSLSNRLFAFGHFLRFPLRRFQQENGEENSLDFPG